MASITLRGNLGQDPVALENTEKSENNQNNQNTQSGSTKTNSDEIILLSVAENKSKYNEETKSFEKDGVNWFKVACFGHVAAKAKASLKKGDLVRIEGSVKPFSIENDSLEYPVQTYRLYANEIEKVQMLSKNQEQISAGVPEL